METRELLQKYLEEKISDGVKSDIELCDYLINGSIIKLTYSYKPNYEWDKKYNYELTDILEIEILDYMTWIYNQSNK